MGRKFIRTFPLLLIMLLVGCSTPKTSLYREVATGSADAQSKNKWSICRNGAFSDKRFIRAYLNGDYVDYIHISLPGFNKRIDIVEQGNSGVLELRQALNNDFNKDSLVAKFKRPSNYDDNIYIVIDSSSTGGWVIPLPFLMVGQVTGERSIKAVSKQDFEKFCGDTSYTTYTK